MTQPTKFCPKCYQEKPLSEYHTIRTGKRKGQLAVKCRSCVAITYEAPPSPHTESPTRNRPAPKETNNLPIAGEVQEIVITISPPVGLKDDCAHHFILEKSKRETSWGICILCRGAREFKNSTGTREDINGPTTPHNSTFPERLVTVPDRVCVSHLSTPC